MQSTSDMFEMPSAKIKLRNGQVKLVELIRADLTRSVINAQLPMGYGKTVCAALAYGLYRQNAIVNRMLVVVPSDEQRNQYLQDFADAAALVGVPITAVKAVGMDAITLRYHRQNLAEVYVATVQQLCAATRNANGFISDLMAQGRWMLVADEHHHYAVDMPWGDALKALNVQRTLALSATPIRANGEHSIFGEPILKVSFREAREEQAIKQIRVEIGHYFVDVEDGDGQTFRLTTESLREEKDINESFSVWETKRQLRYLTKYLSPLLISALGCLNSKLIERSGEHQMIVFAMSCKHARIVSEILRSLSQGTLVVGWVGVGPDGRSDQENREVLDGFKAGRIHCLVQVDKAGEGFDVKTASVLVFLSLIGMSPKALQQVGRGLRRNPRIQDYSRDICDVFVPADSKLAEALRDFEAEIEPGKKPDPDGDGEGNDQNERYQTLPEWAVIDAEFDRSEVFYPIDPHNPMVDKYIEGLNRHDFRRADDGEAKYYDKNNEAHRQEAADILHEVMRREAQKCSEDDRLEQLRSKCAKAVNTCAGNFIKRRSRGSFEKGMLPDIIRLIHGYWRRHNSGHDAMTVGELRAKYEWVRDLNDIIVTGQEMPKWLQL